jgi:hypothetical protein
MKSHHIHFPNRFSGNRDFIHFTGIGKVMKDGSLSFVGG